MSCSHERRWSCDDDDDDDDDVKNHFYNTLQAELWKIPGQDPLLVTGDMNAKVGTGSNNYEKRIGEVWMRCNEQ